MKIYRILTHVCLHLIGFLYYCCYAKTSSPAVQKRHSKVYGNPIAPSLYSILLVYRVMYRATHKNETSTTTLLHLIFKIKINRAETEFKEFESRLKFKPRLKNGWFHLKSYILFQALSPIETGFWRIEDAAQIH